MPPRLKVLMSAYACEPGKGSEPEVGWQWALQMARFHDVTVLTRANNRPAIEAELEKFRGRQLLPGFVYHDRTTFLLNLKQQTRGIKWYYLLWQRSAHELVARLHQEHHFDLMHHVTFAGFRYPTAIWGHGVPTVWGPVGGIESVRWGLLPWHHPGSLLTEALRGLNNFVQAAPFQVLPKRAGATTQILASTHDMRATLSRLGFQTRLMPTVGLNVRELPFRPHAVGQGPLRLLFVGNVITLKGADLALDALAASGTEATLTVFGEGNFLAAARRRARRLGLAERVFFKGRLPRAEVLKVYPGYDVFLFPSLHDTGGYALLEAMLNEVPAICLDCGGPAVAVAEGRGLKIPLGPRRRVVAELAAAIRRYNQDRALVAAHGQAARAFVLGHYDWDTKGEDMNAVYAETVRLAAQPERAPRDPRYSGLGGATRLLNRAMSFRGALVAGVLLFLVGTVGFASVSFLKREAREIAGATLPSLHHIGAANASMDSGFKSTLMLVLGQAAPEREALRKDILEASATTTMHLEAYRGLIRVPSERRQFDAMLAHRAEYLRLRDQMISLVESNRQPEAFTLCRNQLLPAFTRYKEEAEDLLEAQLNYSKVRSARMIVLCTVTQVAVAVVAVLLFVLGFILGFFK